MSWLRLTPSLVLAVLLTVSGCTYGPGDGGETEPAAPAPADTRAASTEGAPRLLETVAAGEDLRYVLEYRGVKFQVIAGESGLFGIKVLAPNGDLPWYNLYLSFSPRKPRPRLHSPDEIVPPEQHHLDYIPEGLRDYVLKAQELALFLAPGRPVTGEASAQLPRARTVLKGVELSPRAANELALFARTDRIHVGENLRLPMEGVPEEVVKQGFFKLKDSVATAVYLPQGSYLILKLPTTGYNSSFALLYARDEPLVGFAQTYRRGLGKVEQMLTYSGGSLASTYYTEEAAASGLAIPQALRTAAGGLLALLDSGQVVPPSEMRNDLVILATIVRSREEATSFEVQVSERRGIDYVLDAFEQGK